MTLTRPDGVIITPDNLPDNAGYAEVVSDGTLQTMYLVPQAMPGQWLANLSGPVDDVNWGLFVIGNEPPPHFTESAFSATVGGGGNQLNVGWDLAANQPTTVAIYANREASTLRHTQRSGETG